MASFVIFEDGTNDQHAYPMHHINAIFITSATNITVYARNPVQPNESVSDDTIALTVTSGGIDDTLDILLTRLYSDTASVTISANTFDDITTVAYTAGA